MSSHAQKPLSQQKKNNIWRRQVKDRNARNKQFTTGYLCIFLNKGTFSTSVSTELIINIDIHLIYICVCVRGCVRMCAISWYSL